MSNTGLNAKKQINQKDRKVPQNFGKPNMRGNQEQQYLQKQQ